MSWARPAVSWTGSEVCSLSQSSIQWSMTRSPSTHSRKPLSELTEKVWAPVVSGTSLPVQRTLTSSAWPVVRPRRGSRLSKSSWGSKATALSSWKSKAPGAEWVQYSPFSPWTSTGSSSAAAEAGPVAVRPVTPSAVARRRANRFLSRLLRTDPPSVRK